MILPAYVPTLFGERRSDSKRTFHCPSHGRRLLSFVDQLGRCGPLCGGKLLSILITYPFCTWILRRALWRLHCLVLNLSYSNSSFCRSNSDSTLPAKCATEIYLRSGGQCRRVSQTLRVISSKSSALRKFWSYTDRRLRVFVYISSAKSAMINNHLQGLRIFTSSYAALSSEAWSLRMK